MRPKTTSAGFTLPEVLAAMVIFGMVLTMAYSVWSTTLNVTQTGNEATLDVQRERMALKALTEALAGASLGENRTAQTLQLGQAEGFSHLKIVARVPPGFWGERELGGHSLRRIEFFAEPKEPRGFQLVMLQQSLLASTNSLQIHRTVLLPNLETFLVEVPSAGPGLPWSSNWPLEAGTNALPRQAKVTLAMREKSPRKKTLTIFANANTRARGLPMIGRVVRVSEVTFGEDGFDIDGSDAAARIIFIIDKSGSMRGSSLVVAKDALLKSLQGMDEKGKFYIYFFNRSAEAMPSAAMLEATPDNISRVTDWVANQEARGGSDPGLALKAAFAHGPTELFLLSDGGIYSRRNEQSVRELLLSLNSAKAVTVNTVGIGDFLRGREDETLLMLIAKDHGGSYTSLEPLTVAPPPPAPPTPPPAPKK